MPDPEVIEQPRTEETQDQHEIHESPEAEKPETTQESETETETQERKGKGGFSKKINKLTARNYQLEETNAQLQARLDRIERQLEGKSAPEKPETSTKPTPDKFQTYEEYVEALADWKTEQKLGKALEERDSKAQQQEQEAQTKATFASYNKRVSEARGIHEDFDEVVGNDDISVPASAQLAIIELENGPEVAYYLGKNPEEAAKLLEMTDRQAIMAIGRISDSLTKDSPEQRPVSRAAAPVKPVGSSSTRSSVSLEELPQREYNRIRNEQEQKRRLGR